MKADVDIPGMPPERPDLARLETIVTLCEQRVRRADAKVRSAAAEQAAAAAALEEARAARDAWAAENEDQLEIVFR